MTSSIASIEQCSDDALEAIVDRLDRYSQEHEELSLNFSKAMINLAKAKKGAHYGSFSSIDDIRLDIEASVFVDVDVRYKLVDCNLFNTGATSNDSLHLFAALPNRNLRLSQTYFKAALESSIKLAELAMKLQKDVGLTSIDEDLIDSSDDGK